MERGAAFEDNRCMPKRKNTTKRTSKKPTTTKRGRPRKTESEPLMASDKRAPRRKRSTKKKRGRKE